MEQADKTYSIGTVAKLVGIPKYKLRHWCNRYLPHIERIQIGEFQFQRRFTGQDIELIGRIKAYRQNLTFSNSRTQPIRNLFTGLFQGLRMVESQTTITS